MRGPLGALARAGAERLRRSRLLAAALVPHEIHTFDRQRWVLKETEFGLRLWCSLDDLAISRPILVNAYDRVETQFVARVLREGDLVVDAGANIGYYTFLCAHLVGPAGRVEAFEPLPYLADALEAGVAENALGGRIAVHRSALDERPGSARLRHAPRTANFGGGHLAPRLPPEPFQTDETVTAVRLDDVLGGRRCRFVKLDVEGAEPRVLRGARGTLAASRPVLLAELHDTLLRRVSDSSATGFIAEMKALGYRCRRIAADGSLGASLERYGETAPLNVAFEPVGESF